jgi:hypothetical protein
MIGADTAVSACQVAQFGVVLFAAFNHGSSDGVFIRGHYSTNLAKVTSYCGVVLTACFSPHSISHN